jgi:hypothetical protein
MSKSEKYVNQPKNFAPLKVAEKSDPRWQEGTQGRGLFCDDMLEPYPMLNKTVGDEIVNKGNSWIRLGRDRYAGKSSGYGGGGATQASAIDICVGMGTGEPAEKVDPNFKGDAARIYISQRCDIDTAFNLITPNETSEKHWSGHGQSRTRGWSDIGYPENQSAIGIKADSIRVIGANGIKLITRQHNQDSRGGTAAFSGIELVAGNDESELQYMVKGENLSDALSKLEERVAAVSAFVFEFLAAQIKVNGRLAMHSHAIQIGPATIPTTPSLSLPGACLDAAMDEAEALVDNFKERMNLQFNWHQQYLSQISPNYILSKYNKVN